MRTLELKLRGFLLEKEMELKKETKFVLAPEERAALIEAKYARARAQVEAMIAQVEAVRNLKKRNDTTN